MKSNVTGHSLSRRLTVRFLTALACAAAGPVLAASIGLNPLMGDGAAGRTTALTGSAFGISTAYAITVGGFAVVSPATVSSNAAGVLTAATVVLPALPAGNLDVVLTGGGRTITFTGAYRVTPNVGLDPTQGEGRPGKTWLTTPQMPVGGWDGMVFTLQGTGFSPGVTITHDTITVGGVATKHADLVISAAGRLSATGVIVTGNLSNGRKDLVINDGTVRTFSQAYDIRRSFALRPSRGERAVGTTLYLEGWGFTDGNLAANTIQLNGIATQHPLAAVVAGHFTVTLTVTVTLPNNSTVPLVVNDGTVNTWTNAYFTRPAPNPQMTMTPGVYGGGRNAAILVEGLANWNTAGIIPANSSTVYNAAATAAIGTTHWGITITGGHFTVPTWVMVNGTAPADIDRLVMVDAAAALVPCPALNIIRTIGVNPLLGSGAQGWSVSVTGSGFTSGNFASETLGGAAVTTNPSPIAAVSGGFGPVTITPSLPLANGAQSLVLNDGAANTFAGAISVVRTIGLDPVVGIGNAGATTLLRGTGFAAPTLLANTVTLSGNATTHAAATVTNGGFGPVTVTLPGLNGGAYDAFMQSDAFVGAYHVVNPAIQMTKYAQPRSGFRGDTVTYTFSFTNTLGAAEPPANGVAIIDTIPAGMRYVAGSPTSSLAATIDWFSSLCTCYTAVEPAPANVVAVRWTLSSPLPTGASGYAGFQVTVQ